MLKELFIEYNLLLMNKKILIINIMSRSFKVINILSKDAKISSKGGRYKSKTPANAARKAFNQIFRKINKATCLSGKSKLPLDKLSVGAASSREFNCRGWKPLPHSITFVLSG